MLRRFGFGRASTLEATLAKSIIKLDELFENEDLLQEVHLQNTKLITFLRQPGVLSQLVNYIVSARIELPVKTTRSAATDPKAEQQQQQQHDALKKRGCGGDNLYMACEILGAGVPALMDGLVYSHPELLTVLWAALDQRHTLTQRQLAAFCKVNAVLLQRRTGDLVRFIQSHDNIIPKWLYHIFIDNGGGTPYLSDLLVSLIQCEGTLEGAGIAQWLVDHDLVSLLVDKLQPDLGPANHEIAQQLLCDIIYLSPLLQGKNPLIEELTSVMTIKRVAEYMLEASPNAASTFICGTSIVRGLRQYNERILGAILESQEDSNQHLIIFDNILEAFVEQLGKMKATAALGLERLSICELLVELLYCSSVIRSDAGIQFAKAFYQSLIKHNAIPKCLDLFFAFPSNNILHNSVYALLREIFTGSPRIERAYEDFGLVEAALDTGRLIERILEAYEQNEKSVEQKLGRLGYMGHLALLSKDISYVLMEKDTKLKRRLFETDTCENELFGRWSAHITALQNEISQQLTSQGEPIFWNGS
ncbi:SIT4 phosphatase-associated protein-domain-containing protein [Dichotomocladium elegans]|nr:SIT4 phosphatase-associated protein-domain-containing protein [Dichotomocladium elegans]